MAVPFYLQGTQTAGLLSNPNQAQTQYVPGQGMAPYASAQQQQQQQPTNSFNSSNWDTSNQAQTMPMYFYGASGNKLGGEAAVDAQRAWQAANNNNSFTNIQQDGLGWGEQNRTVTSMLDGTGGGAGGGGAAGGAPSAGAIVPGTGSGPARVGTQNPTSNVSFQGNGATNLAGGAPGSFGAFQMGQSDPQNYMPGQQPQQQSANGLLGMQQAGSQGPMDQYMNTAGYQLTEGQGAVDRFQESPGYQYAVDQAMKQTQQNAASRGLLDSGRALQSMTDRAHQLGNQEWNNWQNRQQQMYNGYQNRLQGLAGGPTGADYAMQTGQGMAANSMNTGSNIGSLLGSQGNAGLSAGINTGAAQAGNVMTAGNQQAQILGANSATQMSGAIQGLF